MKKVGAPAVGTKVALINAILGMMRSSADATMESMTADIRAASLADLAVV